MTVSYPFKTVYYDISDVCNASCPWCERGARKVGILPQGKKTSPSPVFATPDSVYNTLSYLLDNHIIHKDAVIALHNWGEPLLNPHFVDILRVIKSLSLFVSFSTNASHLVDLGNEDLLSNANDIIISTSGNSQASYNKAHGFKFSKIKENIEIFQDIFLRAGFKKNINLTIHLYKYNLHEVQSIINFANSRAMSYNVVAAYFNSLETMRQYVQQTLPPHVLEKAQQELYLPDIDFPSKVNNTDYSCPQYKYLSLTSDAMLSLCYGARLDTEEYRLAPITKLSLKDICNIRLNHKTCKECNDLGIAHYVHNHNEYTAELTGLDTTNFRKYMVTKTTIGIPVYNEVKYIEKTLLSVVGQADQVVISDNASTDGTSEICQFFARKYPEIKYFRYDTQQNVVKNFENCLVLADNEYFMWVGGHDWLSQNYVKSLKNILDNSDAVLAYSNVVHMTSEYVFNTYYGYDYASKLVSDDPSCRVRSIIEDLTDCTIYYGLYRKEILQQSILNVAHEKYDGIDHGLLAEVAYRGKMQLCHGITYYRITPRSCGLTAHENWTRVMQALKGEYYKPGIHIPEWIPISIYFVQMNVAKKVAKYSTHPSKFLADMENILLARWGVNALVKHYIKNIF